METFRVFLNGLLMLLAITGPAVLVMVAVMGDFRKHFVPSVIVYTWIILMIANAILNVVGMFLAILLI